MKFIQKLEIAFGALTLVTASIFSVVTALPAIRLADYSAESLYKHLGAGFLMCVVPAGLVAFGSIFHSIGRSQLALIPLVIGGILVILVFGLSFLGFAVFTGLTLAILFSSPALFAMITVFLALRTQKLLAR